MEGLNFQIIYPAIDIILVLIIVYSILYREFAKYFKKQINKIFWIDFQIFIILAIFFYFNYHGQEINFFGLFKIGWFLYFMVMSTFIESFFFAFYTEKMGSGKLQKGGSFKFLKNNTKEKIIKKKEKKAIENKIKKLKKEKNELEEKIKELRESDDVITKKKITMLSYKILEIEGKIKKLK